jgi:hypothetical protein
VHWHDVLTLPSLSLLCASPEAHSVEHDIEGTTEAICNKKQTKTLTRMFGNILKVSSHFIPLSAYGCLG